MTSPTKKHKQLLLPTAGMPPLEYFLYLISAEVAWVELHETYPKQTWRNRSTIMTANGPLDLVIPVSRPDGNQTITRDVVISDHEKWHKAHWRAISSAYKSTPYFLFYGDLLEPFFKTPPQGPLWEFNKKLLGSLLSAIGISTEMRETTSYKKIVTCLDLRDEMTPKLHRRRQPVPREWPEYYQVFSDRHGFIPNMSIIDLLFHLGPDTKSYLHEAARKNLF